MRAIPVVRSIHRKVNFNWVLGKNPVYGASAECGGQETKTRERRATQRRIDMVHSRHFDPFFPIRVYSLAMRTLLPSSSRRTSPRWVFLASA